MRALPLLLLLLTLAAPPGIPAVADEASSPEAETVELDPVIASVVRMLDEKVPSSTISAWLDQIDTPPSSLSADDMIALTRAGASDELIQKILVLGGAVKTPTPAPQEREQTQESGEEIPVVFVIGYSPQLVDYQLTPWDLFVYVDGEPLVRADGWASHTEEHRAWLTFSRSLPPGRHVVRLLQEQHELKSKRKGTWSHTARVMGGPIFLDLEHGGDWQLRVEAREGNRTLTSGKVQFEITRNGKPIGDGETRNLTRKDMPPLCEELEQTLPPKELDSKSVRNALSRCVRWDTLWERVDFVPERAAVREEMQALNFELVPGGTQ